MILRRILVGLILALLLSASSLGAACDLSCAFDSMNSDCHSERAEPNSSAAGSMTMAGMQMPGMTMQEMGGGQDQQAVSAITDSMPHHGSIGEMGPCERQTCDGSSAFSANTNRTVHSNFHSISAAVETPRASIAAPHLHNSWGNLASNFSGRRISLQLILRV
jgi:hypothetical protein